MTDKTYKTLIFDLEATLVGLPKEFYIDGTRKNLEKFGVELSHEEVVNYLAYPENERSSKLILMGVNPPEFFALWNTEEMIATRKYSSFCYPDAEVLKDLKEKGIALGLATGAKDRFLEFELELLYGYLGEEIFDQNAIINTGRGGDKCPRKPAPDCINRSIDGLFELGYEVDLGTAAMVGNDSEDILAAKNAGVDSILVVRPHFDPPEKPTIKIPSLRDLIKYTQ